MKLEISWKWASGLGRPYTSQRQGRQISPMPLLIALVPLETVEFLIAVHFSKENLPGSFALSRMKHLVRSLYQLSNGSLNMWHESRSICVTTDFKVFWMNLLVDKYKAVLYIHTYTLTSNRCYFTYNKYYPPLVVYQKDVYGPLI